MAKKPIVRDSDHAREAQQRNNIPIDKAGRDYIARHSDKKKWDDNYDKAFPNAFVPHWKRNKEKTDE